MVPARLPPSAERPYGVLVGRDVGEHRGTHAGAAQHDGDIRARATAVPTGAVPPAAREVERDAPVAEDADREAARRELRWSVEAAGARAACTHQVGHAEALRAVVGGEAPAGEREVEASPTDDRHRVGARRRAVAREVA